MAYLGNLPTSATFAIDTFNGDNSTVNFTLREAPATTAAILVFVNGVRQHTDTYSLSGSTLIFSEAPPTDTNNIQVLFLGLGASPHIPSDYSVSAIKIQTNAITSDKIGLNQITSNLIAAGTITGDKIAANTLTGNLFLDGTITGQDIAANTIGSSNLTITGVTAGSYGGVGNTTSITVDAQGRITRSSNIVNQWITTGSDVYTLGNVGIATTSPISKLHIFKSSDNQLQLQCDNTGTVTIDMGGTTTPAKGGIRFSDNTGSLFLRSNSTTQATIDSSGNVGIGTTSPTNKLDVYAPLGAVNISSSTGTNHAKLQVNNTGGSFQFAIENSAGSNFGSPAYSRVLWNDGAYPTILYTNSTQRVHVDASGLVGVGVTPVANNGILQLGSYGSVQTLMEKANISATAATANVNFDAATQAVLYYTSNASANWTLNVRANNTTALNTIMQTGQSLTVAFLVTQGATPYYNTALQVDGAAVTAKWQSNTAPTAGNASSVDVYTYTIIKTGSAAFTVLASQVQFK